METTDLSEAMPEKVAELRAALAQEKQHMAPPIILEAEEEARAALLDSPPRAAQADQLQLQSDAILQAGDHGPPGAEPEPEPEPV